jgi:hypothetical protein
MNLPCELLFQRAAQHFGAAIRIRIGDQILVAEPEPDLAARRKIQTSYRPTAFGSEPQTRADSPVIVNRPLPVDLRHLYEPECSLRGISRTLDKSAARVHALEVAAGRRRPDQDSLYHCLSKFIDGHFRSPGIEQFTKVVLGDNKRGSQQEHQAES